MYALLAFGAIGVTLVVATLIGYVVHQRTQWDVKWGKYCDKSLEVSNDTLVKIVLIMDQYKEIDHPLHSALMPIISEHNDRTRSIKSPRRHRL